MYKEYSASSYCPLLQLFAALLRELDVSKDTEMHHFMALRHGRVICECYFAPYPKGMWHVTHSMCKSITGMAIGMLVEEGKLKLDENWTTKNNGNLHDS